MMVLLSKTFAHEELQQVPDSYLHALLRHLTSGLLDMYADLTTQLLDNDEARFQEFAI